MKNSIIFLFLFNVVFSFAQTQNPLQTKDSIAQKKWVDSVFSKMTLDEKIGQLFMIQAYSNKDKKHTEDIKNLIREHHIGGLIFMQGTAEKQAELTNLYQANAKLPLLIGFDGEWGLDMRLQNTYRFPWNMTLGAIANNNLLTQLGKQIGNHCKRIGIHVNFAPVVDININPNNPIIGNRSYGENRENVTQKAKAFVKGMQSVGVLATAKHFPGHGDTAEDSHKKLPVLNFSRKRLDSVELYPYKYLIKNNLTGVMVAHLNVPSLEPKENLPSSLSKNIITHLLKEEMAFNGLIFTDALNMKGASAHTVQGEVELKAFMAGNDVLLIPENVVAGITKIKQAITKKEITEERLNHSVKKILQAKYWAGLHNYKSVKTKNLKEDLHTIENQLLHQKLVENATTLLKNKGNIYPVKNLEKQKIAYVKLGDAYGGNFLAMLKKYAKVDYISDANLEVLLKKLKPYNLVIIGYHKSNKNPWKSYSFTKRELALLQKIAHKKKVIFTTFTSPYSLLKIKDFKNIEAVLVSYQNSKLAQEVTAQQIFGAIGTKGKLPISIQNVFAEGYGLQTNSIKRLAYSTPEDVGLSSKKLSLIDSVAQVVLKEKMAPGMQILVARYGKVVYQKSFGYHTGAKRIKVRNHHLYDVASLTKILASLPLLMELEEKQAINLESTLGELLPELKNSNKDTLSVKEILSHYGRLKPWIPFYTNTLDSSTKKPSKKYYSTSYKERFSTKIAKKLYLKNTYKDSIFNRIKEAEQLSNLRYRYSDLPYYLVKKYIERYYNSNLNALTKKHFYQPLGANNTTYNPLWNFSKNNIVPTEKDTYYRNQLVHGYVHDMGAAMQGGIGGHAGLFSNANDVAKIMQMYLQKGYYGGKRYFKPKTINKFNYRYYEQDSVRRGVGFDKPQIKENEKATCGCVSEQSFGHSGFTGTYTWADPKSEIIYVFLSNRIYPTMENKELVKENIRTKIQQLIQDAIIN